jgi:hypothetical protein
VKKDIEFTTVKGTPTEAEALAISHALAEIVNRTFAHQELLQVGSAWADPRKNFRVAPNVRYQGWQINSL